MSLHPDPFREIDRQPQARRLIDALETRGHTRAQQRLRRRFFRLAGIAPGAEVLEVGCGSGVIVRDLLDRVGPRGRVVGVDVSRLAIAAARALARAHPGRSRMILRVADGARLPFRAGRFDVTLAVTVLLHAEDPAAVVKEMVRVTRPGGRVGVQDQDFGTVVVDHPDRALSARILEGVAARMYAEPFSGRRLPRLLREAGLEDVRVLADVYQDTRLAPYTKTFLERRAENAVRFGLVNPAEAQRWLDAFTGQVARGTFLLTTNYYGAVGTKR